MSSCDMKKVQLRKPDGRALSLGVQAGALGQDVFEASERTFSHEHTVTHDHA